jgi:hypothetical protein
MDLPGASYFYTLAPNRYHVLRFRGFADGVAPDTRLRDVQISAVGNAGLCLVRISHSDECDVVAAHLWAWLLGREDMAAVKRICRRTVVRPARHGAPPMVRGYRAANGHEGEGPYPLRRSYQRTASDEHGWLALLAIGWPRDARDLLESIRILRAVSRSMDFFFEEAEE